MADDYPVLAFASSSEWERWLSRNHAKANGVWVKFAKKGTGIDSVTYGEALEVALCYGWIDATIRRLDEIYYVQRFTPRRARSKWSKINRDNVERLIEAGRMRPAGQAEIDRAKADGRWDAAYDGPATATEPPELVAALRKNRKAKVAYENLTRGRRYSILFAIHDAKKPETKERRIAKFIGMLERGETDF